MPEKWEGCRGGQGRNKTTFLKMEEEVMRDRHFILNMGKSAIGEIGHTELIRIAVN